MAGIPAGSYTAEQTFPIDCSEYVDYSKVKGKTVLITGGTFYEAFVIFSSSINIHR